MRQDGQRRIDPLYHHAHEWPRLDGCDNCETLRLVHESLNHTRSILAEFFNEPRIDIELHHVTALVAAQPFVECKIPSRSQPQHRQNAFFREIAANLLIEPLTHMLGNLLGGIGSLLNTESVSTALNNVLSTTIGLVNSVDLSVDGVMPGSFDSYESSVTPVLDLFVAPVHLDLLGAVVDTSPIHLTITAVSGPDANLLLGNVVAELRDMAGNLGYSEPKSVQVLTDYTWDVIQSGDSVWNPSEGLSLLLAGNVLHRFGTKSLSKLGGLLRATPGWGVLLAAASFAVAGSPPFGTFLSEWLLLRDTLAAGETWAAALVLVGLTITFLAVSSHLGRVLFGPDPRLAAQPPRPAWWPRQWQAES